MTKAVLTRHSINRLPSPFISMTLFIAAGVRFAGRMRGWTGRNLPKNTSRVIAERKGNEITTVIFKPRTEQEIAESRLLPKGDYDFEILEAAEKNSKTSGKPMIELKIRVSNGSGSRTITDYLLAETPEKLRHAAVACGLLDRYESGSLSDSDFRGKRGRLKLAIEKDKKKQYPDKNIVAGYICAGSPANDNGKASGSGAINFRV
jgi:hypothetical protein